MAIRINGPLKATRDHDEIYVEAEDGLIICWCENALMTKVDQLAHARRVAHALNQCDDQGAKPSAVGPGGLRVRTGKLKVQR